MIIIEKIAINKVAVPIDMNPADYFVYLVWL